MSVRGRTESGLDWADQRNLVQPATAQPATGLFGAKPAGFGTTTGGFGQTTTAAPAFGAGTTTAFGQQPTTSAFGGAATTGFGGMSAGNQTSPTQNLGTGNPSFQPFREQDTSAAASTTNIFHTITAMPNYKNWSLEELRLQDYLMGKKAPSAAPATGFGTTTTGFGAQPASTGLFGTTTTTSKYPWTVTGYLGC